MGTQPNLDTFYTVTVYSARAEHHYTYGPFTEAEADAFIERADDGIHAEPFVNVVNHPSTFGTGLSVSF